MAHHSASLKHIRATERRTIRNRMATSTLKTAVKKARQTAGSPEAAEALRIAFSVIDKSAKKGLIHRNNAANAKSRLSKLAKVKTA